MKIFICLAIIFFGLAAVIKWDTSQPRGLLHFEDFQDISTTCSKNNGVQSVNIKTENSVNVEIICNDKAKYSKEY